MESKQKYIPDNYYYEVDDWFVDKLKSYPRKIGIEIASMVDYNSYFSRITFEFIYKPIIYFVVIVIRYIFLF